LFGLKTFKGGVHPRGMKSISENAAIKEMPIPDELVIPLSQHTGAPAELLVKKGDKVLKGQKIGEAKGFISACVHSPASGEVTNVAPYMHPLGRKAMSVFIKPDGLDEWAQLPEKKNLNNISPEEIISRVKESGIVGLGGAAFPSHVKLSPPKDKKIDTLIINAVECEPYLTADYRVMLEETEKVILGTKIFLKALGIGRAAIAVENNKPKAIEKLSAALAGEKGIELLVMETKYPQGSEKQLIAALTKREVPQGKLPLDVGVVVQNVGTACAAADAVMQGKPLIDRVVTVTGGNIKEPSNLRVRIGTRFSDAIAYCGGAIEPPKKVIMGGPMMGIAVPGTEVPVVKGTSGILLLKNSEISFEESGPCIRCGRCVEVCPMGLAPGRFVEETEFKDFDGALKDSIMNCMECGSCSFVCPARRPMVHWIKLAKSQIGKMKK